MLHGDSPEQLQAYIYIRISKASYICTYSGLLASLQEDAAHRSTLTDAASPTVVVLATTGVVAPPHYLVITPTYPWQAWSLTKPDDYHYLNTSGMVR